MCLSRGGVGNLVAERFELGKGGIPGWSGREEMSWKRSWKGLILTHSYRKRSFHKCDVFRLWNVNQPL